MHVSLTIDILEQGCFSNCFVLKEIKIPDEVRCLPKQCFQCCYSLEKVTLGKQMLIIDEESFLNCESLTDINATLDMMIDSTSFKGCDKLDTSGFCG